jgi:hypothetical protein
VTGALVQDGERAALAGTVRSGVLHATARVLGMEVPLTARPAGSGLQLLLEGDDEPTLFERRGGAPAARAPAPGASAAGAPAAGAPAATAGAKAGPRPEEEPAPRAGAADGRLHRVAHEGWSVRLPEGWDGQERDGALALGSRTEAGLLLVQATPRSDPESLRAGLGEVLAELGFAGAAPSLEPAQMPGGRGLAAEFPVTARDGTALRLRAVAVACERGAVAMLAVTTAEKMGALRRRVDEMARSVRFFTPEVSAAQRFLAGEWWGYSSAGIGATGGTESALAFCPDGRFFSSSESSYSGGAGTAGAWGVAGQRASGGGARWTAVGTPASGRVTVTRPDGRTSVISWQAKEGGGGVYFDGSLHARTGENKYCR